MSKKTLTARWLLLSYIILFISCQSERSDIVAAKKIEKVIRKRNIKMGDLLGINAFEWDFLQNPNDPNIGDRIYEPKFNLIKSFGSVRQYIDWEKLENTEGSYTFNPTNRGGWNYDIIYERSKQTGIDMLPCIKNTPDWIFNTYPVKERGGDNIPAVYGSDLEKPKSYIAQARTAFQFAARYGSNKAIDSSLVKVNTLPRWNEDRVNTRKIGLNTIKYIECENEPDKWWLGKRAQMNGRQFAANLSAFYDGHKGTLGKNVGIKTADPNMTVVMGGLGRPDLEFVKQMVEWCKEHRGYKANGKIDLCFDVLNYHLYSNDNTGWFGKFINKKRGVAPELTNQAEIANTFVDYAETLSKGFEVWITESGYDLGEGSIQRAIAIGEKSALITQADWILRSSLLYARHGINHAFYYQLYDDRPDSKGEVFGSAGFVSNGKRRPVADYFIQVKGLMGHYVYYNTVNDDPIVDIYRSGHNKIYVLVVPDETGRTENYELALPGVKKAVVYTLNPGSDKMISKEVNVKNGKFLMEVTETPVFVQIR